MGFLTWNYSQPPSCRDRRGEHTCPVQPCGSGKIEIALIHHLTRENLLCRSLRCCPGHQGLEGAPEGSQEGEEHPAQRQHHHGRHHRRRPRDGSPFHGQGVLRNHEGGAWHCSVCRLHCGRNGPPRCY